MSQEARSIGVTADSTPKQDTALEGIFTKYLAGELSAPVALMQLLIETEDVDRVRAAVASLTRQSSRGPVSERAKELEQTMIANADGCARIAAMLRADVDSAKPARSVEEGIAFSERLFDWSVKQSEEASVALYSLGNPQLLEQATAEIVTELEAWGVVTPNTAVLDIGCGIGRLLIALAPKVQSVTGIDVSAEMVKAARRRCASLSNATVIKGDGHGLTGLEERAFDVAIAVDSFPYLRQSGYELVERFVAESARVLRPGGELAIFNYSYSDDDDADRRELRTLAAANRFELLVEGTRPFELWDGLAFRMKKIGERQS